MKEKRESRRGKGGREEKSLTVVVAATEINHYEHNGGWGGGLSLSIGELYCWQTEVVPVDVTVMEKRWDGNAVIVALPLLMICGLWYIHSFK